MPVKKTELKNLIYLAFGTGRLFYVTIFALFLTAFLTLSIPISFRMLIDQGIQAGELGIFILFSGLAICLAGGTALRYYAVNIIGEHIFLRLREMVFKAILAFTPNEQEKYPIGDLMSRMMADAEVIRRFAGTSLGVAARNGLLLMGGLGMMFFTYWGLALLSLCMMPVILIPIFTLGRRLKGQSKQAQMMVSKANSLAEEIFYALPTVQNFTRQDTENKAFLQKMSSSFTAEKKRIELRSLLTFIVISLVFISVVGILFYGTFLIANGTISSGILAQFLLYAIFTAGAASSLSEVWGDLLKASAAYQRITEIIQIKPLIDHREGKVLAKPLKGNITFENVSFGYMKRSDKVLDNLSFKIRAGDKVILKGKSGTGKSSLFQLILRHRNIDQGKILLDDHDISTLQADYVRGNIAYISQDITLFTGTIGGNILVGNPSSTIDQVIQAAKDAYLHDFILTLPNGYDTHLGDKGMALSGGQKQRLALARGFLKQAPILLLDEPTSALDPHARDFILKALENIDNNTTIIMISHDLKDVTDDYHIIDLYDLSNNFRESC